MTHRSSIGAIIWRAYQTEEDGKYRTTENYTNTSTNTRINFSLKQSENFSRMYHVNYYFVALDEYSGEYNSVGKKATV